MAINIKGSSDIIRSTMKSVIQNDGSFLSSLAAPEEDALDTKRIKVKVKYNNTIEEGAIVTVLDRKTGKQQEFIFKYFMLIDELVNALENRDMATVRVLRAVENFEDIPVLWKEEWKNKRCMYQGVPNAAAMSLLTGLRKPIPMGWVRQKDGNAFRGGIVSRLFKADLMRAKHLDKGRVTYSTNGNGYDVLKHWAGKNKLFAPYLQVFLPDGWEENELATQTFLAMHGRLPERKSANAPLIRGVFK